MNQEELQNRILMRNHLEQQESEPAAPYTPSTGMSPEEMNRYIQFLFKQLEEIKGNFNVPMLRLPRMLLNRSV